MKKILFFALMAFTVQSFAVLNVVSEDTNENNSISEMHDLTAYFTDANAFMNKYVNAGRVDYAAIQTDRTMLDKLVDVIASAHVSDGSADTQIAFYINAYNILTIKNVVDNMPIKSPLDVQGFFDTKKFTVAGASLTLNEIENKKLRPDPRVHFVLVCAAKGCPKIINEAYMPDKVQAQLNAQTKKALNDPEFIKVDATNKKVQVSQIFEWYKDDFMKSNASIREFINRYRTEIPADYTVEFYTYNWDLNKK
ncbi:MAG: DUF547 domain-containing protein [Fimbriimonadaceae bacterium]|nr:DUF547 domain-containing protein [Chitinophagales bacterium]